MTRESSSSLREPLLDAAEKEPVGYLLDYFTLPLAERIAQDHPKLQNLAAESLFIHLESLPEEFSDALCRNLEKYNCPKGCYPYITDILTLSEKTNDIDTAWSIITAHLPTLLALYRADTHPIIVRQLLRLTIPVHAKFANAKAEILFEPGSDIVVSLPKLLQSFSLQVQRLTSLLDDIDLLYLLNAFVGSLVDHESVSKITNTLKALEETLRAKDIELEHKKPFVYRDVLRAIKKDEHVKIICASVETSPRPQFAFLFSPPLYQTKEKLLLLHDQCHLELLMDDFIQTASENHTVEFISQLLETRESVALAIKLYQNFLGHKMREILLKKYGEQTECAWVTDTSLDALEKLRRLQQFAKLVDDLDENIKALNQIVFTYYQESADNENVAYTQFLEAFAIGLGNPDLIDVAKILNDTCAEDFFKRDVEFWTHLLKSCDESDDPVVHAKGEIVRRIIHLLQNHPVYMRTEENGPLEPFPYPLVALLSHGGRIYFQTSHGMVSTFLAWLLQHDESLSDVYQARVASTHGVKRISPVDIGGKKIAIQETKGKLAGLSMTHYAIDLPRDHQGSELGEWGHVLIGTNEKENCFFIGVESCGVGHKSRQDPSHVHSISGSAAARSHTGGLKWDDSRQNFGPLKRNGLYALIEQDEMQAILEKPLHENSDYKELLTKSTGGTAQQPAPLYELETTKLFNIAPEIFIDMTQRIISNSFLTPARLPSAETLTARTRTQIDRNIGQNPAVADYLFIGPETQETYANLFELFLSPQIGAGLRSYIGGKSQEFCALLFREESREELIGNEKARKGFDLIQFHIHHLLADIKMRWPNEPLPVLMRTVTENVKILSADLSRTEQIAEEGHGTQLKYFRSEEERAKFIDSLKHVLDDILKESLKQNEEQQTCGGKIKGWSRRHKWGAVGLVSFGIGWGGNVIMNEENDGQSWFNLIFTVIILAWIVALATWRCRSHRLDGERRSAIDQAGQFKPKPFQEDSIAVEVENAGGLSPALSYKSSEDE